jgi:hypothetical protein
LHYKLWVVVFSVELLFSVSTSNHVKGRGNSVVHA